MPVDKKNEILSVLDREWEGLRRSEKKVIERICKRHPVSRNMAEVFNEQRTVGEKIADAVAAFGGSWTFIIIFCVILAVWIVLNSYVLASRDEAFDPYPYILLNLFLSMTAALQAPIIMMSQNRQAAKDRLDAANDYEVNLKAELEISDLHRKIDELRERYEREVIDLQHEQIKLLQSILENKK